MLQCESSVCKTELRGNLFASLCKQKKYKGELYEKGFNKITGVVMAAAMAMSILITGKVDTKAAAALNVNQEYRLNFNDDNSL